MKTIAHRLQAGIHPTAYIFLFYSSISSSTSPVLRMLRRVENAVIKACSFEREPRIQRTEAYSGMNLDYGGWFLLQIGERCNSLVLYGHFKWASTVLEVRRSVYFS
ncbi:MAG: hypothetical protein RLZZ165_1272 [Bacteroidota bacterium]